MGKTKILSNILKKFNNDVLDKILSNVENKYFSYDYVNNVPTLNILNKTTKKSVMIAEYQYIGIYNKQTSIFHWAWNLPFLEKKVYQEIIKIKDNLKELENNYSDYDPYELEQLHFYLDNDHFYCSSDKKNTIAKIVMYFFKGKGIISINNKSKNIVEYILIKNINSTY